MEKNTKDTASKSTKKTGANTVEPETFTFKRSHVYALLIVLAFATGLLLGYVAWGRRASLPVALPAVTVVPTATTAAQVVRYEIPTEGFPAKGPADAPITLVEFSDYQCPYCKQWYDQVEAQLFADYPGQIRFVYRNFPLTSIHPEALPAALAAYCAGQQIDYYDYHAALFSDVYGLSDEAYQQYATELGLDLEAFNACRSSAEAAAFIEADMDFSINLGVRSTPTFFINGLAVIGAQPIEVFKQIIDQELAGAIPGE